MKKLISLFVLAFIASTAHAKVVTLQVTLGASATALTTGNLYYKWLVIQNNAAHTLRVGDSNVSATRGMSLQSGGAFYSPLVGANPSTLNLFGFYAFGTSGDVLDIIYDDGQ